MQSRASRSRVVFSVRSAAQRRAALGETGVVRRYVRVVRAYCKLIEHPERFDRTSWLDQIVKSLLELTRCSLDLPDEGFNDRISRIQTALLDEQSANRLAQAPERPGRLSRIEKQELAYRREYARRFARATRKYGRALDRYRPTRHAVQDYFAARDRLAAIFGGADLNWVLFDPHEKPKPIRSSVAGDLAEIWHDVSSGLRLFELGRRAEQGHAVWSWWFEFRKHWYLHAAHALPVLFKLMNDDDVEGP